MNKDNRIYLDHILNCFSKVQKYVEDISYENFLLDEEKQDAVIRKIEVAGEATKRLDMSLREKYNHVPWRGLAGMRDKLIHGYFDVDLDMVWETATEDIPYLIPILTLISKELEGD